MAEAVENESEEKASSKKGLLAMVAVVVLAVAASIGGTLYFVSSDTPEEAVAEPVSDRPAPAVYHQMRPAFVVNYVTASKPRYLQVEISVMSRMPSIIEAIIDHMPLVRSAVLETLNSSDFELLRTHQGKEALLEELRDVLNAALEAETGEAGVESVLFTNFVLQ